MMVIGIVITIANRSHSMAATDGVIAVESGTETCGQGWSGPSGGLLNFAVHNTTIAGEDVYLQGAHDELVYGELEGLGTGATHNLNVALGNGQYRFVCIPSDLTVQLGPIVTVSGVGANTKKTPGIRLVTNVALIEPTKTYHAWVLAQLPILLADVQALDSAVASANRSAAKSAWLAAHLEYETLGAAYGTFGDVDGAINGAPASGTTPLADPDLTGFHRIEAQLWAEAPLAEIAPVADQLVSDVTSLQAAFGSAQIPALDVGLRSHEILENAIQFELTASTDAGSHTTLATIGANLLGTRQALSPLMSLLKSRYPDLTKTEQWLDRSTALVDSFHHPDGSWTPLQQLSQSQRETLDSTLNATVELLAPVAAITDPRQAEE